MRTINVCRAIVPGRGLQVELGQLSAAQQVWPAARIQNPVVRHAVWARGCLCQCLGFGVKRKACRGKLQCSRCQQQPGNECNHPSGAHNRQSISEARLEPCAEKCKLIVAQKCQRIGISRAQQAGIQQASKATAVKPAETAASVKGSCAET